MDTVAGPQIVVRNGLERESLDAAMARLKVTEEVGALFTDGKVDVRKIGSSICFRHSASTTRKCSACARSDSSFDSLL